MFGLFDEEHKSLSVDDKIKLVFVEQEPPFYSKLYLYKDDKPISDCGFKPEEREQIKKSMISYDTLMGALKNIQSTSKSPSLEKFVVLLEDNQKNKKNAPVSFP